MINGEKSLIYVKEGEYPMLGLLEIMKDIR